MSDPFELKGADFDEPPWNYLIALMLVPEDAQLRAKLLRAGGAENLERCLKENLDLFRDRRLPLDMTLAMLDHGKRWKELERAVVEPLAAGSRGVPGLRHGGQVAGMTLLIPLFSWLKKSKRQLGRGDAYRILGKWAGPGAPGASERKLKSNWMKYRAASHVWAAAHLRPDLMFEPEGLSEFISLAQQIRIDAGAYTPPHALEPLLPLDVSADLDVIDLPDTPPLRGFPRWIDHIGWSPELLGD